eukprot:7050054-Pyramimonas_sp.AAC.1
MQLARHELSSHVVAVLLGSVWSDARCTKVVFGRGTAALQSLWSGDSVRLGPRSMGMPTL